MSHSQHRWLFAFFCLLIVILAGGMGWLLLSRQTAPRTVLWLDEQNRPLFAKSSTSTLEIPSCRGDISWQTVAVGSHVWGLCTQGIFTAQHPTRYGSGVFVRFDLSRHVAQVMWPLPKELAHFRTIGLLPLDSHTLGIVYRANHAMGPLVVGITGPEGWRVPPTALPSVHRGRLLGMRWQGHVLEFVVTSSHVMDRLGIRTAPVLFTMAPKQPLQWQQIPRQAICQNHQPCHFVVAYSPISSSLWHMLVVRKQVWEVAFRSSKAQVQPTTRTTRTTRTTHVSTKPHPSSRLSGMTVSAAVRTTWQMRFKTRPELLRYLPWLDRRIDFSATGLLPLSAHTLESRWNLADGSLSPLTSMVGWRSGVTRLTGHFLLEQGQFSHRLVWAHGTQATLYHVAGQTIRLALQKPKRTPVDTSPRRFRRHRQQPHTHARFSQPLPDSVPTPISLTTQRIETWRTVHVGTLARDLPHTCASLFRGTWVERPQKQGHWLVSPTGCLLAVDPSWKRLDSLNIVEHLQQRAKAFRSLPPPPWTLLWLLCGGPFCLGLGWFIRQQVYENGTPPVHPSFLILNVAAFLYLLSGLYFGWRWWFLLSSG